MIWIKKQIGFVTGTHVNIQLFLEEIQKKTAKSNERVIFIDFSSAYNTINKNILFDIIEKAKIFSENELKFLELL